MVINKRKLQYVQAHNYIIITHCEYVCGVYRIYTALIIMYVYKDHKIKLYCDHYFNRTICTYSKHHYGL